MNPNARSFAPALMAIIIGLLLAGTVRAQLPTTEERLKVFTDPEDIKKKLQRDKDKTRPPIEMFRSQVAPFDILPFVKPNHWSTFTLEVRANYDDYSGSLQTAPIPMIGLPMEMVYRRDARLPKTQRMRLGLQILLPAIPKPPNAEINLELIRPDAVRPDEVWPAPVRALEGHQMLILFLTKESSDAYAAWNRFHAFYPRSLDRMDATELDRARYYRPVLPLEPEHPPLSSHPLTWTTISHVVWDGMPPDRLNPSQQQAMLDWIHWGGQLTFIGGAGPGYSILKDSFLSPYLPAEVAGESALLARKDLAWLSDEYRPLYGESANGDDSNSFPGLGIDRSQQHLFGSYREPVPIKPAPNQPVFLNGLQPKPGAVGIPVDEAGERFVGVEWRVGRGRVLMLAVNPTESALASWPGLDTFVRRVVLRRPDESRPSPGRLINGRIIEPQAGRLVGADLSWFRYLARDLETPSNPIPLETPPLPDVPSQSRFYAPPKPNDEETERALRGPVADWVDGTGLPRIGREALEEASGIKIPNATFVLKIVLAYILTLVPLNWLICRYLLNRRELAWIVVPILSLAFAIGVERAAALDMGYNSACDEIDVLEVYGGYPRAHLSRFSSLYSTGRTHFTVSYPDDPTALALPLDTGRTLRGEDISTAVWQSYPVPALEGFLVQPRSLAMLRSEQLTSLDGAISLVSDETGRKIVNGGSLEIRDAVVVDVSGPDALRETYIGDIAPGATVDIKEISRPKPLPDSVDTLGTERFLNAFRNTYEDRPESRGEIRLVGWSPKPMTGQKVEPAVDRHRGFTAIVVHLRNGTPPPPDGPTYNKAPDHKGSAKVEIGPDLHRGVLMKPLHQASVSTEGFTTQDPLR